MLAKLMKRTITGIAYGCTISVFIQIVGILLSSGNFLYTSEADILRSYLASIITGIAWVVPSLIYDNEKLPFVFRVLFHMSIGFSVYLICAFYAGWIPQDFGIGYIISFILIEFVISILIWSGFYFYYRHQSKLINEKISIRQK